MNISPIWQHGNQSDKIAVTGAANIGGNVIITPTSPSPPAGTYTLLTSSSLTGTAPTLNVPTGTRQTFALHFGDTVPNAITLNVTGANKSLTWTGAASGTWDLNSTLNWSDNGGTTTNERFFQLDAVTFGNGPTNRNIALELRRLTSLDHREQFRRERLLDRWQRKNHRASAS